MKVNVRKIERCTERIMNMLGINGYVNNIEFRTEKSGMYGYMQKEHGGYNVVIYVNECKNEKEIIHTIAHELRHVWQHKNNTEFDTSMEYNKRPHEVDAHAFTNHFFSNINNLSRLVAQGFNPILEKKQLKESIRDFGFKGCM